MERNDPAGYEIITYFKLRENQNGQRTTKILKHIITYFKLRENQNRILTLTLHLLIITYFKLRENQNYNVILKTF